MATIATNWKTDGWTTLDWQAVEDDSRSLLVAANDLDDGVGGGGGGFTPDDLREIAGRADAIAKRLRDIANNYV
jgi:hypothetical protein